MTTEDSVMWYRAEGAQAERERIIALLEAKDHEISMCCPSSTCCLESKDLIALIKDEQ